MGNSIVIVPKSNGEIRLCIDERRANVIIEWARQLIAMVYEILHGSKQLSKLDLKGGFHKMLTEESSQETTKFTGHVNCFSTNIYCMVITQ